MVTLHDNRIQPITGSSTGPFICFGSDTTTGIYRTGDSSASSVFTVGGNTTFTMSSSSNLAGNNSYIIVASTGSVASPAYSFSGAQNTGLYAPEPNTVGFVQGGTEVFSISSATGIFKVPVYLPAGSNANNSISMNTSAGNSTGLLYSTSPNPTVYIYSAGSPALWISKASQLRSYGSVLPNATNTLNFGRGDMRFISLFGSGLVGQVTVQSTNLNLSESHFIVRCTAAITLTLPLASDATSGGRVYLLINDISAGGTVTINASGSDTINDGSTTSITLTSRYEHIGLFCDANSVWYYI